MAESNPPGRQRAGPRVGTRTWPLGDRARQAWGAWPDIEFAVPTRLREWAAVEVGAGRLLPWFAVAFGTGVVLYFTADHEPALWAVSSAVAVTTVAAVLLRQRPIGFVVALGFLAIAAGFATATIKTALIEHPVLRYPGIMAQTPLNPANRLI